MTERGEDGLKGMARAMSNKPTTETGRWLTESRPPRTATRALVAAVEQEAVAGVFVPHPGEPHKFQNACVRCGDPARIVLSVLGYDERFEVVQAESNTFSTGAPATYLRERSDALLTDDDEPRDEAAHRAYAARYPAAVTYEPPQEPERPARIDWSNVVVDEGDEAP